MRDILTTRRVLLTIMTFLLLTPGLVFAKESGLVAKPYHERLMSRELIDVNDILMRYYTSDLTFDYPDAVRGIYVTGPSAGGERFKSLTELISSTDLNTMVIDVKEDFGKLTFKPTESLSFDYEYDDYIKDIKETLKTLEEKEIYPIARIVDFKDSVLAKERPDLSFTEDGSVWVNGKGEAFVNPFEKEVWEYNVELAKYAAKLGFQDIQFDYVRFPEGFETRDESLEYTLGDYEQSEAENVQKRVEAVTEFVQYAKEELEPYDVDVSVDIFGYAATVTETPGIGQNFAKISENVDVISSMIYPSHWT